MSSEKSLLVRFFFSLNFQNLAALRFTIETPQKYKRVCIHRERKEGGAKVHRRNGLHRGNGLHLVQLSVNVPCNYIDIIEAKVHRRRTSSRQWTSFSATFGTFAL